jgi:hypothetical protein
MGTVCDIVGSGRGRIGSGRNVIGSGWGRIRADLGKFRLLMVIFSEDFLNIIRYKKPEGAYDFTSRDY